MHTGATKNGKKRIMCASRIQGKGCQQKSALLEVYEAQIEAYLENFVIPEDYQDKILDAHRRLRAAYDDTQKRRAELEAQQERLKKQFRWGHIDENEYLAEWQIRERELKSLTPSADNSRVLERLAAFLKSVAQAWQEATQEQRNRLGRQMFEEIWIKDKQVIAVRPRPELEPFFRLSFEEWRKKFESENPIPFGVACNIFCVTLVG
jgi:hypothetical protein